MYKFLISILAFSFIISCENNTADPTGIPPAAAGLSKITDYDASNAFVDENGDVVIPWGFNYTNPQKIGLIEDKWDQESTWNIIAEDFEEMKTYTANTVRIHLQYNKFMINKSTPNQKALDNLEQLTTIAEKNNLYLLVTGLGAYRKSDSPEWYDSLNDSVRWETQALFWKSIAKTIEKSNAVFAYDLMNEPVVSVGCGGQSEKKCDWLPGEPLGGFHFVQNIALDPDKKRNPTFKNWMARMTTAIRSEDSQTLITVGMLPLGPLDIFAEDVDFISTHIYPESGDLQASIDYVTDNQSNKPFVMEEFYNLNCSIRELESFLTTVDDQSNGTIGHYFGKTLEKLEADSTITAALHKSFIEFFIANNPN